MPFCVAPAPSSPTSPPGRWTAEPARCTCCCPGELQCASGDRKSTRLNSSHDQISYAVFCLKKKKKQIISSTQRNTKNRKTREEIRKTDISKTERSQENAEHSTSIGRKCEHVLTSLDT